MSKKVRTWVVYREEETPLLLTRAITKGGAFKNCEEATGISREYLHAEVVEYEDKCFLFVSPI